MNFLSGRTQTTLIQQLQKDVKIFDDLIWYCSLILNTTLRYVTAIYYCQVSNIKHILVGNKIVDHSDIVGALPVGAAPTTSSFST